MAVMIHVVVNLPSLVSVPLQNLLLHAKTALVIVAIDIIEATLAAANV